MIWVLVSGVFLKTNLSYLAEFGLKEFGFRPAYADEVKKDSSIKKQSLCEEKKFLGKLGSIVRCGLWLKKDTLAIFKQDGSRQCEPPSNKSSLEQIKNSLKAQGVKVFCAKKGSLKNSRGIALCGAPTSNINIFYISQKNKAQALKMGFKTCIAE